MELLVRAGVGLGVFHVVLGRLGSEGARLHQHDVALDLAAQAQGVHRVAVGVGDRLVLFEEHHLAVAVLGDEIADLLAGADIARRFGVPALARELRAGQDADLQHAFRASVRARFAAALGPRQTDIRRLAVLRHFLDAEAADAGQRIEPAHLQHQVVAELPRDRVVAEPPHAGGAPAERVDLAAGETVLSVRAPIRRLFGRGRGRGRRRVGGVFRRAADLRRRERPARIRALKGGALAGRGEKGQHDRRREDDQRGGEKHPELFPEAGLEKVHDPGEHGDDEHERDDERRAVAETGASLAPGADDLGRVQGALENDLQFIPQRVEQLSEPFHRHIGIPCVF